MTGGQQRQRTPIDPGGITDAAADVWVQYATDKTEEYVELAAKLQAMMIGDPQLPDATDLADCAALIAEVGRQRNQAFLDAFALGCTFMAGIASSARNDSRNKKGGAA